MGMFPTWMSQIGSRDEKMDLSSSPQSEQSVGKNDESKNLFCPVELDSCGQEKDNDQVDDFGAAFLADLHSDPDWDGTIERKDFGLLKHLTHEEQGTKSTLPESFSPVYSARKEPRLRVVEMYVKKDAPFEWTDEYNVLDLGKKIEAYNSIARGMEITLHEDGITFGGNIHINMNLSQDITVIPPTVFDFEGTQKSTAKPDPLLTTTSFDLPQDTTEVIDIDSKTTAKKLIVKLFKKLRIVNYPREYALYEYEQHTDENTRTLTKKLTLISDDACPLKVILDWPIPHCGRALVLMENRDLQDEDFDVPLLENFMRIAGLKAQQVHVREQENPRNGSTVTTYSKQDVIIENNQNIVVAVVIFIFLFSFIMNFVLYFCGVIK